MIKSKTLVEHFKKFFGTEPTLISRAPGRVNIIGEHTDYNGGFVFPAAINCEMKMTAAPRTDTTMSVYSVNFGQNYNFDLSKPLETPVRPFGWAAYFVAVVDQFQQRGITLPGLNVAIDGDVPLGAGLSSSAAYEVCAATMLNTFCETKLDMKEIAILSQAAEHSKFVGVNCGIMDQFISALGKADHCLQIDCYSLDYKLVPFDSGLANIVIINSEKRRGLVDSEYNTRRSECEQGLKEMRELAAKDYKTIRHIPLDDFNAHAAGLSTVNIRKRLKHNITENARVLAFADALIDKDFTLAGKYLYESHASLRDDFQVSCRELDFIVDIARTIPGTFGCRMTGAGFGGCCVALVKPNKTDDFIKEMDDEYHKRSGLKCTTYVSTPCDGANANKL